MFWVNWTCHAGHALIHIWHSVSERLALELDSSLHVTQASLLVSSKLVGFAFQQILLPENYDGWSLHLSQ